MVGIVVPETCWAYKKHNKIIIGIYLVFYSSVITMMHGPMNIRFPLLVSNLQVHHQEAITVHAARIYGVSSREHDMKLMR